ncbi:Immunoglobulin (CD79A) binding protein 1 [Mactra antiquata]
MAESSEFGKNLPETFSEILEFYDKVENCDSTSSDATQGFVYHACEACKKAISMVNQLDVFSKNEEISEVTTSHLRYMLLPAFMGYFVMKNNHRSRLNVVTDSKEFYTDYLKMCNDYGVTNYQVPKSNSEDSEQTTSKSSKITKPGKTSTTQGDIRNMAVCRNSKIQRYKEQKDLDKRLTELKDKVENADDDVQRDYYLTLIKKWVNTAIDELDSIQMEMELLKMMEQRKGDKSTSPPKSEKPKTPSVRPFIITKDSLQKQVYGLGYPAFPTMTIEEFFDKKVEEGTLHAHTGGHSMEDWAKDPEKDKILQEEETTEKEIRLENDDPDELRKAREWDEYKDGLY